MNAPEIVELEPAAARLTEVWPVMRELRAHLTEAELDRTYAEAYPDGYRVAGLFVDGTCRAAAGYRFGRSFANGRYLYVEDLVTAERWRSSGYGKALLGHLVEMAGDRGCDCVTLDSGVHRFGAHRFYLREGFVISSHHFWRGVDPQAAPSSMREGTR